MSIVWPPIRSADHFLRPLWWDWDGVDRWSQPPYRATSPDGDAQYFDRSTWTKVWPSSPNYPQEYDSVAQNVSQQHLDDTTRASPRAELLNQATIESVTAALCDRIEENKSSIATATKTWKDNAPANHREQFLQGCAMKVDHAIFGDRLFKAARRPVQISFTSQHLSVTGRTHNFGGTVMIELNHNATQSRSVGPDELLAILLHHMAHAFLMSYTPNRNDPEHSDGGESCGHGKAFGAILYAIKDATGLAMKFNHFLSASTLSNSEALVPARAQSSGYSHDPYWERGRSTRCSNEVVTISQSDCDKWYTEKCKPLINKIYIHKFDEKFDLQRISRRNLTERAGEYLEALCAKQNIYIPRNLVAKYPSSIGKQFSESAVLSLPSWAKKDMLVNLYHFLQDESYKPKVAAAQDTREDDKARSAKYTAPLLFERKDKFHPYMLTDIKMYKLAKQIKFDELAKYAMKRLETIHFTHENVVEALNEVYWSDNDKTPGVPDEKLRAYAVNFFKRYSPVSPFAMQPNVWSNSNLWHLYNDSDYRRAWQTLSSKEIPVLQEDIKKAWHELNGMKPTPFDPPMGQMLPGGGYPFPNQQAMVSRPQMNMGYGMPASYPGVHGGYITNGPWSHAPMGHGPLGYYGY